MTPSATPANSAAPDPRARRIASMDYSVLQQCMHCGLCLPACPTYEATRLERHSPRGRIRLLRGVADGELPFGTVVAEEMYYCLGCLACTSACPAGVDYARLFEAARADAEDAGLLRAPQRNFWRALLLRGVFTRPRLLRALGRALWLWEASGGRRAFHALRLNRLLSRRWRELEARSPKVVPPFSHQRIAPVEISERPLAGRRVALLTGCVQDLFYADINRDTADVLLANGCEVHTPPVQPCCGSLHAHNGDEATARLLARRMIDLIPPERYDAILSNAGGCGSHIRHYSHLLHGDAHYAQRSRVWDERFRDAHAWLDGVGLRAPTCAAVPLRVAYHDSCHLAHGQKVTRQPRDILRLIPGLELVDLPESDRCCGSAGIYSLTHPDLASALQERKLRHILSTGCTVVATANPGCHLQLQQGAARLGHHLEVRHPLSLLAAAYRRERTG